MQNVCLKFHFNLLNASNQLIRIFSTAAIFIITASACRPAIDDNAADTSSDSASSTAAAGSVSTSSIANAAVTPEKLSQAYLPLAGGTLTGALIAPSFSGDGSALTSLSASNISSGTLSAARLPAGTSGQILTTSGGAAAWAVPNYFVRDQARDLVVANNATTPNSKVDVTVSEIILKDTSGYPYLASTVSLTLDITASGANGLDTGAEANSTWYHIWVISNGTTVVGLFSTSATAPTMPSGYTYKAYAGAIYNSAGGDLIRISQLGRKATTAVVTASSACPGGSSAAPVLVSLSTTVPSTAISAHAQIQLYTAAGGFDGGVNTKSSDGSTYYAQIYSRGPGGEWFPQSDWVVLSETQKIYWFSSSATSCVLSILGWEF